MEIRAVARGDNDENSETCLGVAILCFAGKGIAAEDDIVYNFENDIGKWKIPDWAYYQDDHRATELSQSDKKVSEGKGSLEIMCNFPGDRWAAALVESEQDLDLSGYNTISADVYLPKNGPRGFMQARFILTVGVGWHFIEQRTVFPLIPGKWTTITVKLDNEENETSEWKGRKEKRLFNHINAIKKIAVRIEYDSAPPHRTGPVYKGPVYVDNIVIKK